MADLGKRAVAAEGQKDYQQAYDHYLGALNVFKHLIKYEKNASLQQIYIDKMKQYLDRAEYIKKTALNAPEHQIAPSTEPTENNEGGIAAPAKKKKKGDGEDDDENKKLQGAISQAIVTEKPNIKWDDVAGLESAKEALKEAIILPIKFP